MIKYIEVLGDPYQQGVTHGCLLSKEITNNIAVYYKRFYEEAGLSKDEVLRRAKLYSKAIEDVNPDYARGLAGISEGSKTPFLEIVALNIRYEILYFEGSQPKTQMQDGCTAFALSPKKSLSGHLIIAQNWDWIPNISGAIVHTKNDNAPNTLAFTEAGIFGGKIGFNSVGLGLMINGLSTTTEDWISLAKPFHVRCYEILKQFTFEQAINTIITSKRPCSANFLIAKSPNNAINIETTPSKHFQMEWEEDIIVHTNHFVGKDMLEITEPLDSGRDWSCIRREQCSNLLNTYDKVAINDVKTVLSTHRDAPPTICRHLDTSAPPNRQYLTAASVIIDLNSRYMLVADGPPCSNHFIRYDLY